MPTYEYHCEKCGHSFEVFQPITDAALQVCPKDRCPRRRWGKGQVKRAVGGGSGLLFKGSGFYITDYRSEGYRKAAKQESSAAAPAKSGDNKPASTSATGTTGSAGKASSGSGSKTAT